LRQRCRKNMKREKMLELTLLVKSIEWKGAGRKVSNPRWPIAPSPIAPPTTYLPLT
jgi:hypothetical protein